MDKGKGSLPFTSLPTSLLSRVSVSSKMFQWSGFPPSEWRCLRADIVMIIYFRRWKHGRYVPTAVVSEILVLKNQGLAHS